MAKKKITPRQAGNQKSIARKEDPQKLRMRAEELKLKAASLSNEADDLFAEAEQIEAAQKQQDEG
jgi:FtsZ-binding cell division protein ZapB